MQILTVLAVVIVLVGVYFGRGGDRPKISSNFPTATPEVLSEGFKEEEPTPTPETLVSPTPFASSITPQRESSLNIFIYPNAEIISQSSGSVIFESTDNPDVITEWYKTKINAQNLNVTSFVTTSTNDNILNKLVGANSEQEIRVEITKSASASKVRIEVALN